MTLSSKKVIRLVSLLVFVGVIAFVLSWNNGSIPQNYFKQSKEATETENSALETTLQTEEQVEEPVHAQYDEELVERWIHELTLEEKIGQMFMPQLKMWAGQSTTTMNEGLQQWIQNYHLGGVILFEKNIENIKQLVTLNHTIQEQASRLPLFISIDQEGGKVRRIPGGSNMPGNMALGAIGDEQLAYEAGSVIGRELHALGVNLNFAPVLDVNNNQDNPVIGVRSFGEDPNLVAKLGVAYIQGLQDTAVMATAKHFPGHGDTDVDSHLGLPVLQVDRERMEEIELLPFRRAIEQGVDMIMTAHVTFPRLDNTKVVSKKDGTEVYLPATLSYKILTQILREELIFDGVIVTDAFTMKAISDHFGEEEAVLRSIQAGADIILMPRNLEQAYERVLTEVQQGNLEEERINQSVRRILRLKSQYGLLPEVGHKGFEGQASLEERIKYAEQMVGNINHQQTEQKISEQAVTVVKNEDGMVPFTLNPDDRLLILAPTQGSANRMVSAIQRLKDEDTESFNWNGNIDTFVYTDQLWSKASTKRWGQMLDQADYVLIASQNISQKQTNEQIQQGFKQMIAELNTRNIPYVWLGLEMPYDIVVNPETKAYLAIYGTQVTNLKAGLSVIFGLNRAQGSLPVTIPDTVGVEAESG